MDLRESIKNIITNKAEITESFREELEKHFSEKQIGLREEDLENLPANLPEDDFTIPEDSNMDADMDADINLDMDLGEDFENDIEVLEDSEEIEELPGNEDAE